MSPLGYIGAAYGVVLAGLAAYALSLVRRERRLRREVEPDLRDPARRGG